MQPHLGAGAGQSMEDGWVLGRAISEYLSGAQGEHFRTLETTAQLYQNVRLPRAQKTQATSRAAGNTYEMQTEDMLDKSFEECVPMIGQRTRERMKWIWEEDLDAAYERGRDGTAEPAPPVKDKPAISGAIATGQGEAVQSS
jgi:salicylate hydroxylase